MNLIPRLKFIAWEVLTHYVVIFPSQAGYLKANAKQFVKIKSKLEIKFCRVFITTNSNSILVFILTYKILFLAIKIKHFRKFCTIQ